MREDYKIRITELAQILSQRTGKTYSVKEVKTLIYGWRKHPKYLSPSQPKLVMRQKYAGEIWLTTEETVSFMRYAGYPFNGKI